MLLCFSCVVVGRFPTEAEAGSLNLGMNSPTWLPAESGEGSSLSLDNFPGVNLCCNNQSQQNDVVL